MLRLSAEDFIFEVKEELSCFEDVGKSGAEEWAKGFKVKFSDLKTVTLDDESEIFEIADEYIEALESGSVQNYWKNFKL